MIYEKLIIFLSTSLNTSNQAVFWMGETIKNGDIPRLNYIYMA